MSGRGKGGKGLGKGVTSPEGTDNLRGYQLPPLNCVCQ